jgi:starch synthase
MKKDPLKVLMCASEMLPFAKTGGLADVMGSLPKALRKLGCEVKVFMPLYREVRSQWFEQYRNLEMIADKIFIPVGIHHFTVYLWRTVVDPDIEVYFLEKDEFFDRSYLYGNPDPQRGDYEDNAERFILFCRAVYALCVHTDWFPHIFHIHDWQASLVAPYLVHHWRSDPRFASTACILTIHNLAFQGIFPGTFFSLTHLPPHVFTMEGMEYWGQCNFLKAGIVYSDFVTTVSPRYAEQIQTAEHGYGLDGVLRNRRDRLVGILNGIDAELWNPATDPFIAAHYSIDNLEGKKSCKKDLLQTLGLPLDLMDAPLCATIGRLTRQKGYDLIYEIAPLLFKHNGALVILGKGERELMELFIRLKRDYPTRCAAVFDFDEPLSHKIEAGADIFLMPSRFEPCGLNQMYSLRYGTVPVVHATGGLDDTVDDVLLHPEGGTGFKFYAYGVESFWEVLKEALKLYENKTLWRKIQINGMKKDYSWDRSAKAYLEVYKAVQRSPS